MQLKMQMSSPHLLCARLQYILHIQRATLFLELLGLKYFSEAVSNGFVPTLLLR